MLEYDDVVQTLKRAHEAGIGATITESPNFLVHADTSAVAHAFECSQSSPNLKTNGDRSGLDLPSFLASYDSIFCRECLDAAVYEIEINLFSEENDDWNDLFLSELICELKLMLSSKAKTPFNDLTFADKISILDGVDATRSSFPVAEYTRLGFPSELSSVSKIRKALVEDIKKNHGDEIEPYILSLFGAGAPESAGKFILVPAEGHPYGKYRESDSTHHYHVTEFFLSLWEDQKTACWQIPSIFSEFLAKDIIFSASPQLTIAEPLNLEDLNTFSSLVATLKGKKKKWHQVMPSAYESTLALRA